MIARSEQRLTEIASVTENAHAYVCDVTDELALDQILTKIETRMGTPNVVVHNACWRGKGNLSGCGSQQNAQGL
jgi:short-subunit dehydrogenase involved in D-alanine esterification of teichoic acids